jgi:hypothetical protein
MVAEAYVAVDVEKAVRAWARSLGFTAFFGTNNSGSFPQVVIQRVAGPDEDCLMQFDVWGGTKAEAATVAADLRSALSGLSSYDFDGIRLHAASDASARWLPDPESDRPRYIVEATVTASSTASDLDF